MEIKPGYKQTEVGVIPEDWEVITVSEVTLAHKQGYYTKDNYVADGVRLVRITDLYNPKIDYQSMPKLPITPNDYEQYKIVKGDFLFARSGAIGRYGIVNKNIKAIFGSYIIRFNFNQEKLLNSFFGYLFETQQIWKQLLAITQGSSNININAANIKSLKIPLPKSEEQTPIATALSDTDALIESLEQLIAKKYLIKQGAMQELLTGKRRLPGFSKDWEMWELGNHVTFLRNGVNSRAELTTDDPIKYLHYGDIHGCAGTSMSPSGLPSLPTAKAKNLSRLLDGDLIFADASEDLDGVGKSVEVQNAGGCEFVAGLHTIAARFDKNVLADGFKAYLQFCPEFIRHLRRLAAGTKVYATNRAHIASVEIRLPDQEEQKAMAAIFNDMDAEIAALESKLVKVRQIKQGMMQELLTGRIRLI